MKKLIALLLTWLSMGSLSGQGWERFYSELGQPPMVFGLVPAADGGFLMSADYTSTDTTVHLFLKIGPGGTSDNLFEQAGLLPAFAPAMLPGNNGHLLFAAVANDTPNIVYLTETDANLQTLWSTSLNGDFLGAPDILLRPTPGGYLVAYQTSTDYSPVQVFKTDLNGNLLWQRDYDGNNGLQMRYLHDLVSDDDGNFYLSGNYSLPVQSALFKFSPDGDLLYGNTYAQPDLSGGLHDITLLNDTLLAGKCSYNAVVFNAQNGAVLSTMPATGTGVCSSADGKLFLWETIGGNYRLTKRAPDLTVIWEKIIDRPQNLDALNSGFWPMPDGGVAGCGRIFNGNGFTPFVFRLDGQGNTFTNQVRGNIFNDFDQNCQFDPGTDEPAAQQVVTAQKGDDIFYATTDAEGNYAFTLDSGSFLLRVRPPSVYWELCSDSVAVTLSGTSDTVDFNSAFIPLGCPFVTVDIAAALLRRCFDTNSYAIIYSNQGSVVADSVVVTLILDDYLTLISASAPYDSLGENNYAFYVGDLDPLQTEAITVKVRVSCDAQLGQTHCSSVSITMNNPCATNPDAFPVIVVSGECQDDSVAFHIQNLGDAPMTAPSGFIVIEDLIVMREGQFQLPAQEDTIISCPSDGSTFRMYAGQVPGETPFFSPTAAVEGCNGPVQPGYWTMFPDNFRGDDNDRDCQENIGAYDPNDKNAIPTGYGPEHYIARGVPLSYKIRFQNTGTDTAFTVVIRDTLSPDLNAGSLRAFTASHPFSWQLTGNGVLEFRFDDILLPDSNTNLAGSQGFVSFDIDQKTDLPLETLIENRAGIYFDYNAPIITNTAWHRIGENFLPVVAVWEPFRPEVYLRAVPNPVGVSARIECEGMALDTDARLDLFDARGRLVRQLRSEGNGFVLLRDGLPGGWYGFRVVSARQTIGNGKLIISD